VIQTCGQGHDPVLPMALSWPFSHTTSFEQVDKVAQGSPSVPTIRSWRLPLGEAERRWYDDYITTSKN
jgi:hypothetical protein